MAITATYISANSFSVVGNQTVEFHAGRRVKLVGNTNWYGTIESSVYTTLTTITLTAASDDIDSSLNGVLYGIVSSTESSNSIPIHDHDGAEGSGGQLDHVDLANKGTNTHTQIDTAVTNSASHIADTDNPHDVNKTDVGLSAVPNTDFTTPVANNTTHRGSDGKDHSDVVLNNTHRTSDGTDHANVVSNTSAIALNTTHRGSDGKDHSDVVLNNTHRGLTNNPHSVIASQVSVTDAHDYYVASNVETILDEIGETRLVSGYDLNDTSTLPDLDFTNGTRLFEVKVQGGESNFSFWCNSKKFTKTTTQSVTIPNTTGTYYIYFDNSGVLQYVNQDNIVPAVFYENAITGLVYWNATTETGMAGDERHGKLMDGKTHHFNHATFGARYESGLDITGLEDGEPDYTNTTSGYFWDEDIRHNLALQTTHPFLYRLGDDGEWTGTSPDNLIGFKNSTSNVVWNEWTGSTWQLTESASQTDFIIYFMIATPDITGYNVKKIIGQHGYPNRSTARAAIEDEIDNIVTYGLPNPEFIFLYAYIVKRNGVLEDLADGSTHVDLRAIKGGTGTQAGSSSIAADVTTSTTNFDNHLSATDTNVQTALETLDDHNHIASQVTDFDTEVSNNSSVAANTDKISYTDAAAVGLNTTHRTSDGKDHSDVVLNNTHRGSDGKDHSDVVLNNTHRTSDGKDHSDVVLNNTHRGLTNNPHSVDKTDVGLSNVPNTDFTTAVSLNTAKVTNATHTGEVTGSGALTIADNVVDEDNLKLDTGPTNDYVLTADSTKSGGMKWAASSAGFTDPMTTRGDIIYKNSSATTTRLPAGSANQVLTSDGTDISWEDATGGGGNVSTSGTPVDNDFAKFVNGTDIEGRSYAEVRTDLNVENGAEVNNISDVNATDLTDGNDSTLHYHSADRARANHTGTQTASTISDFDTEVSNNSSVTANTTHRTSDGSDHTFIDQDVTTAGNPTFNSIQFDTTPTGISHAEGLMHWNEDDGTLEVGLPGGDVVLQIGQETLLRAKNESGSTMNNGDVVYVSGGVGNMALISLADADSLATSGVIGLCTEEILNNATGYVTTFGIVRDFDTNSWTAGTLLWLSDTAGELTSTRPTQPKTGVVVAICIRQHSTEGVVLVKTQTVDRLTSLSDVAISGQSDEDYIYYDTASTTWKARNLDTQIAANSAVALNTAKVTNATHTGDVTGSSILTIGANKVNDTHIDWGTGANQVSQDDVVDGGTYVRTHNDLTDTLAGNIATNNAKVSNVDTNITVVETPTIVTIQSSDGTDDSIAAANTTNAGIMTKAMYDEHVVNNNKVTYNSIDSTKVGYISVTQDVNLDTMESNIATNNSKVTNATHTGEVTGSGALTIADNVVDEANLKLDTGPTNDYVLTADSGESGGMKWAAAAGGASPLTTKGDLYTYSTADARLPVGTAGQILTVDTGETTGLKWNDTSTNTINAFSGLATTSQTQSAVGEIEIEFDYEIKKDDGYTHSTGTNPNQITVLNTGWYNIDYSINWDSDYSNRTCQRAWVEIGSTAINQSYSQCYLRHSTYGRFGTTAASFVVYLTANDIITLHADQSTTAAYGTTQDVDTIANQCWIVIQPMGGPKGDTGDTGPAGSGLADIIDDTTPQLGGNLDLNDHYIQLDPTPDSDHTGSGDIATMQVDVNGHGVGAALHMHTDGNFELADADAAADLPCMALALETGTGSKKVLLKGFMRDDTWNWTSIGQPVYVSTTAGGLTQTAPSTTGDFVQRVGIATHADRIFFNPDYTVIEVA